jgi:hypothetical protein
LNPFATPPKAANADAVSGQAAAIGQAAATPAGNTASTVAAAAPLTSSVAVPADATTLTSALDGFLTYWQFTVSPSGQITAWPPWLVGNTGLIASVLGGGTLGLGNQGLANAWTNWPYFPLGNANFAQAWYNNTLPAAKAAAAAVPSVPAIPPGGAGALGAKVAASFGQGNTIGKLSVPQSWSTTTPVEFTSVSAGPGNVGGVNSGPSGLLRGMPMTGGTGRRAEGYAVKYGFRYSVLTRPPSAG